MSRRDCNVRLSIVVPHLGADGPFEDTLISILENRPADVEVIVAHDGSYADPFELSDEVRFVCGPSHSLPDLMSVAVDQARSEFVHVIAGGVRATAGWTAAALELLQQYEVGLVAPLAISRNDDSVIAAGWTSRFSTATCPIGHGSSQVTRRETARIQGACLSASFWNRRLLKQVHAAYPTHSSNAAQYAWPALLTQRGWQVRLASESVVLAELDMLGLTPSFAKARTERELQRSLVSQGLISAALRSSYSTALSLLSPRVWGDCMGQWLGSLLPRRQVYDLHKIDEPGSVDTPTIRLPDRATEATYGARAA